MFKKVLYRLPILLILLIVTLCSCEGRKSKNDLLKESVVKFKDSLEPVEVVKYYPEGYEETKTDTILSNGYSVHVKTFVNMNESITNEYKVDDFTTVKDVFRIKKYEITVEKEGNLILNKKLNLNFFSDFGEIENHKMSKTIVNCIEVNQELSLQDNLFLTAEIVNIPNDKVKYYEHTFFNIIIDSKGNCKLNKLRTFKNLI